MSACLFNVYAEHIKQNARLDESQAENHDCLEKYISKFRCVDDTTLMTESEEELKSLLMRVKEENEKSGLKTQHSKTKIMASGPITSWQIDGEKVQTVTDFIILRLQNHCGQ